MGEAEGVGSPRVVLDTNCVLSALLFRAGRLTWLREGWRRARFRPLVSRDTVAELIRALAYPKFGLGTGEREVLLGDYLPFTEAVPDVHAARGLPTLRDTTDRIFLDLALDAGAEALVTGDGDLLAVRSRLSGISILTASEFADWLEAR